MKKSLLFLSLIVLAACNTNIPQPPNPDEDPHIGWEADEMQISGQLFYNNNPFDQGKDTILCLKNVYLTCELRDNKEYCTYLRELLSQFEGDLADCQFHDYDLGEHDVEFVANRDICVYPILDGKCISLISPASGVLMESIKLNGKTIYLKRRENNNDDEETFYMGDFVFFEGRNDMKPKFITDSISLSGEQIICFDCQNGPMKGGPLAESQLDNRW